nr:NAD(+)--rifampin ADP-ribosyltransferase [Arthrobacter cavernae]
MLSLERSDVQGDPGPFHHGTKAYLKPGDLLKPGHSSNFGERKRGELRRPDSNLGCCHLGSGAWDGRGTRPSQPCGTHWLL